MRRECRERFPLQRGQAVPACITERAWRTCRDACRDRKLVVSFGVGGEGKRSRHSRCMRNPQRYVSDKRPMVHRDDVVHQASTNWHIEAETKLPPFCRHFKFNSVYENCCVLTIFFLKGPMNNRPALVQPIARPQISHKSLCQAMGSDTLALEQDKLFGLTVLRV